MNLASRSMFAPRLFVAVHHDAGMWPIICATQGALDGLWTLGAKYPATHAFVVVKHADGLAWRFDGQPPRAVWAPCEKFKFPTAIWEVCTQHTWAGVRTARTLDGVPYDWSEIAFEAMRAFVLLPWLRRKLPGTKDLIVEAMICTRLALTIAKAAHVDVAPDSLYPERFGQLADKCTQLRASTHVEVLQ